MYSNQYNSLKLISTCPVCKKKHFPADINLIEEQEEIHLFHVRCKLCSSCILVFVNFGEQGVNVVGVLTDLQSNEVDKFLSQGQINSDQVLSIYKKLKNNQLIKEVCK